MEIKISCKGSGEMPLEEMNPFQGSLKELSENNYLKLKNQIIKNGYSAPIFLWQKNILDGHARFLTLNRMKKEGITMPDKFPVVEINADDEKTAKKLILAFSSQYNKMSEESLFEFAHDLDLSFEDITADFEYDAIDFDHFNMNFFTDTQDVGAGNDDMSNNSKPKDMVDFLEGYLDGGMRKISFILNPDEYDIFQKRYAQLKEELKTEDGSIIFMHLLNE